MPNQIIGFNYGPPDKIDSFNISVDTISEICTQENGLEAFFKLDQFGRVAEIIEQWEEEKIATQMMKLLRGSLRRPS